MNGSAFGVLRLDTQGELLNGSAFGGHSWVETLKTPNPKR